LGCCAIPKGVAGATTKPLSKRRLKELSELLTDWGKVVSPFWGGAWGGQRGEPADSYWKKERMPAWGGLDGNNFWAKGRSKYGTKRQAARRGERNYRWKWGARGKLPARKGSAERSKLIKLEGVKTD